MPSSLELALFGLMKAIEGGQAGAERSRLMDLKMEDRNIARRKEAREARGAEMEEFAKLGAPLDVLQRGERLSRSPSAQGIYKNRAGIKIGAEMLPEESGDLDAYKDFEGRLSTRGSKYHRDQDLDAAVEELGQLRSSVRSLTPEQRDRMNALQEFVDSKTGLRVRSRPPEVPQALEQGGGFWSRMMGGKKSRPKARLPGLE